MRLLNSLQMRVRFAVAGLAQGDKVGERVGLEIRREPPERHEVMNIAARRAARLTRAVVARSCSASLRLPVRPTMSGDALARVLRVQRSDTVFIAAGTSAEPRTSFEARALESNFASNANVGDRRFWALTRRRVLTFSRAMFAAAMFEPRRVNEKRLGALRATCFDHGESVGQC